MKQTYKKPIARLEYFALSQSIADNCGVGNGDFGKPGHDDKSVCGWDLGDGEIIWISESSCKVLAEDDAFEGICYHNPDGGACVFAS